MGFGAENSDLRFIEYRTAGLPDADRQAFGAASWYRPGFQIPSGWSWEAAVRRGDWRSTVAWQSFRKKDLPLPPQQGIWKLCSLGLTVMAG